eukprot:4971844-Pyramimonas_sp.AAC.1
MDAALPAYERRMLGRSARAVVGSREKAKEMHSALALQPARKVQREAAEEMQQRYTVNDHLLGRSKGEQQKGRAEGAPEKTEL